MTRIIFGTLTALALGTTSAFACTEADVQERQEPLVTAVQALMQTDPAKAQTIVLKMQEDMAAAAEASDDAAVCRIMDEALAAASE